MATKADVKIMISEAVDPVKSEMADLRNEIETLTKRIQTVETTGASNGLQTAAPRDPGLDLRIQELEK